jgi:hypothetical protein
MGAKNGRMIRLLDKDEGDSKLSLVMGLQYDTSYSIKVFG